MTVTVHRGLDRTPALLGLRGAMRTAWTVATVLLLGAGLLSGSPVPPAGAVLLLPVLLALQGRSDGGRLRRLSTSFWEPRAIIVRCKPWTR